ncbi:hypothetical protein EDC94DRAFT_677543 [Helicostylum pulchrum]|nr:hypothetical protein EDC94DRAFT_677543 [Helicostylum pulchrum]
MVQLPSEILKFTFAHLEIKDLLQCQCTCKQWYEASVNLVYLKVKIDSTQKSILYTRTITNSPRLANYLQIINVGRLLTKKENNEATDLDNLLNVIIQHCPGLLEFHADEIDFTVWTRLTYAGSQGQLPCLQRIPPPTFISIDNYIYTALSFKKTLTSVTLYREPEMFTRGSFSYSSSLQTLFDNIKSFSNLQHLKVGHYNIKFFSYWDTLIQDCPNLKSLTVRLYPESQYEPVKEPSGSIQQRYDIEKLECDWELIKSDNQLMYIMYKFPKLHSLKVTYDRNSPHSYLRTTNGLSFRVISQFLQYVSTIPSININFSLCTEQLAYIWANFMRMENKYKAVNIEYKHQSLNSKISTLRLEKSLSILEFEVNAYDQHLPHLTFLQRAGSVIRSLSIGKLCYILGKLSRRSKIYNIIRGDSWIYQSLQLCPQLQELTLDRPVNLEKTTDVTFQHTELKSFAITKITYNTLLDFLSRLSSNAPNLQELHLRYVEGSNILDFQVVNINMPFTRFRLLTWTSLANPNFVVETLEYYIKLNTMIKKSPAYIHTISNSPPLGKCLTVTSINFEELFKREDEEVLFDKHGLLSTVIRYYPNIIKTESYDQDLSFWTRIMYAATEGQLSHLKNFPEPDIKSLESYIYTTLLFKNSLSTLWLNDDSLSFGPQLASLDAY